MLQSKDIGLIERDIEVVAPDGKEKFKTALKTAKLWLKAPSQITNLNSSDMEKALSVYEEWNKSPILKV